MKMMMAAVLILLMSRAIAGDETTFVLPAQDSAPVTVCATGETAKEPQPSDVLASFKLNAGGTIMVLTRDNATSIVSNVGRAIAHNPNITKDARWNPAWATIAHWSTAATCGLGATEKAPATK